MSTRGQFNTKNPTIKRILKEASELASNPSSDLHAEPLEDNLFEWHFTLRGPPAPSPYDGGLYHGRIVLPSTYPLRPPSFRFLTPTGRFEVNREICLSISGHHEETWQPAWGIRTAMVAIRSFMDTDAKGQVGGIECNEQARKKMAVESVEWKCAACGKSNAEIMKEREETVKEMGGEKTEEVVPEELRLAYRDELNRVAEGGDAASKSETKESKGKERATETTPPVTSEPSPRPSAPVASSPRVTLPPPPARTIQLPQIATQQSAEASPAWIDHAIYGLIAAILFMVLRKVI
ncbi:UBC-like protein [Mytilinidion resinicola]|uniref:UBC-like protein n=1 Tax=Mytilinidion resinicola TaxID=574789 RepID=A0A6A6Z956_9PEZI|nr:UBC-like protein [Mytilinidion resinicola]KAF2817263.1 UBC-like protein [Mytilinidion resinicola]